MTNGPEVPTIVQILDSLGEGRGGLTKAVFERIRLFAESNNVVVATVASQPNGRAIFRKLQETGTIPVNVTFRSFHEDSRELSLPGDKSTLTHRKWIVDPNIRAVPDGRAITRFYRNGMFVGLVAKSSMGDIQFIDVHDVERPWTLQYREKVWNKTQLFIREYYDENNDVRYRLYFNSEGIPYMSTWVTKGNYEYRTIYWPQKETATLKDAREANKIWLEALLAEYDSCVVYFDEPRTSFAASVHMSNVKIVAVIHTTHRTKSGSPELKPWAKHYIDQKNNVDNFVVLTRSQRHHLIEDMKLEPSKVLVIPHSAPPSTSQVGSSDPDSKPFVIVSRLAKEKRIDHAISAYALIARNYPETKLEIYGNGPEENNLEKLISDLDVGDRVSLRGRTEDPLRVFATAKASILTSDYEGFGLVILESMSQGTPVVGYATHYGPVEIISNDNGIPVQDEDVEGLARALSEILDDKTYRDRLARGALATAGKFGTDVWRDNWLSTSRPAHVDQNTE